MRTSPSTASAALVLVALLAACGDEGSTGAESSTDTGGDAGGDVGGGTDAGDDTSASTDTVEPGPDGADRDAAGSDAAEPDPDEDTSVDPTDAVDAVEDTGGGTDDCPDELFVVSAPDPENGDYPDPELDAYCESGELVVTSNGIIGYEFVPMTPNELSAQNHEWRIPLEPEYSETTSEIPLLGVIAFTLNGIPIYGPNEGPTPDPYGDPVYNAIVDWCMGHTAQAGDYHYHALLVECIVDGVTDDGPSPIIGFALDGFPIHGPRGCLDSACTEVAEFTSGWVQTGDPTTYAWDNHEYRESDSDTVLDACNGRIGPDGQYRYHATETFPYVLGCYHGVVAGGGGTDPGGDGSCETADDCAGACPDGSMGCECGTTPDGNRCQPTCDTVADCPEVDGMTFLCGREGLCIPAGGPPR